MSYRDIRVGRFSSPHMGGDVRIEYCTHQHLFYLTYNVEFHTPVGLTEGVARCGYDPTKANEMRAMVLDAMDIAAKPLKDRD